jgi:hypothetical protein
MQRDAQLSDLTTHASRISTIITGGTESPEFHPLKIALVALFIQNSPFYLEVHSHISQEPPHPDFLKRIAAIHSLFRVTNILANEGTLVRHSFGIILVTFIEFYLKYNSLKTAHETSEPLSGFHRQLYEIIKATCNSLQEAQCLDVATLQSLLWETLCDESTRQKLALAHRGDLEISRSPTLRRAA